MGIDIFRGCGEATLSKLVLPPFCKEVYSLRKEFAPTGSKFFPLRLDPSSEGEKYAGKQTGSNKSCLPFTKAEKIPRVSTPLDSFYSGKPSKEDLANSADPVQYAASDQGLHTICINVTADQGLRCLHFIYTCIYRIFYKT